MSIQKRIRLTALLAIGFAGGCREQGPATAPTMVGTHALRDARTDSLDPFAVLTEDATQRLAPAIAPDAALAVRQRIAEVGDGFAMRDVTAARQAVRAATRALESGEHLPTDPDVAALRLHLEALLLALEGR